MASTNPPSVAHLQRIQGYAKAVHNLVFNRNTGNFEVQEQGGTTAPAPSTNASYVIGYTGNNPTTIDMTVGGVTYRTTLTYTGNNVTAVSAWVEQ